MNVKANRRFTFALPLSAAFLTAATVSVAQESPQNESSTLQEVIVTAMKTPERLQDVPMSVTAVSTASLEKSGDLTLDDIGRQVPGLSVTSAAPGQNIVTMRALPAAVYLDDTPLTGATTISGGSFHGAMDPELFDLARVEVLRGPQGTLYGAGSMGGIVRYITNQPDLGSSGGAVQATVSDTNLGGLNDEVDMLINQPLAPGKAAARLTGFYRDYDGYLNRYPTDPNSYLAVLPGPVARHVNTNKTYGSRLLLKYKPLEWLTVTPSAYYQRTDLGAPFTFDNPPGTFDNPIQSRLVREPSTDETKLFALTMDGHWNPIDVTSATSYFARSFRDTEDGSKPLYYYAAVFGAPQTYVYPAPLNLMTSVHVFTEELRGSGVVGPAHFLLGGFYSRSSESDYWDWATPPGYAQAFGNPFSGQDLYIGPDHSTDVQQAIFGEINVEILPKLHAIGGLRAQDETEQAFSNYSGVFNGGTTNFYGSSHASVVTPKYGFAYDPTPDVNMYATATKGFREGGPIIPIPATCNGDLQALGLSSPPTSVKPDHVWDYEAGAKTQWLERALTVDGDVYDIKWNDIQQSIFLPTCGLAPPLNFGTASSRGAELEIRYLSNVGLQVSVAVGYNDAKLTSTVPGATAPAGAQLINYPKWMGSATLEYDVTLGRLQGYGRIDYNTTSYQLNNYSSSSVFYKDAGYSLADLRVGIKRDRWQYSAFVTNLLDKRAETQLPTSETIDLGTQRRYALTMPRTIGVDVRFDF